jgi:hypothetical protein
LFDFFSILELKGFPRRLLSRSINIKHYPACRQLMSGKRFRSRLPPIRDFMAFKSTIQQT